MTRLALLTEIPAPYRIPLFNALADRLDLRVAFLRERNPLRPYGLHREEWRFDAAVLPGFDVTLAGRWLVLNGGVSRAVRDVDVVLLGGWNQPAFLEALALARVRGIPALAWVESTGRDERSARFDRVKRGLMDAFAGFVVPGRASFEYVRWLGVPERKVVVAPNAIDAGLFSSGTREPHDGCRFLYVGRLSREKGIDVLIAAVADVDAELVVAGTGPMEAALRATAPPNVRFLGHQGRDELPALYASADAVVVPSRSETWGMALSEGAAAGLPLVASEAVGASPDLIVEGENGYRVPVGEVGALREALRSLADDPELRTRMGIRSRQVSAGHTPERWADAIATAAASAVR